MRITPIHYKKLTKVFEKEGWIYSHTTGDHMVYKKKGYIRPVVIPMYKTIPIFVIKNNLRTAHISRERYFELI